MQVTSYELRDFDFELISKTFNDYGVSLNDLSAISVAVFDHGNAPAGVSDRQFRFDYLDERIKAKNSLSAFAYLSTDVPKIMTRLQSVVDSAGELPCPLVVMDTAPAAVLGAGFDPVVAGRKQKIICNVGNFHTLAFRLGEKGIEGVFEHHTGEIDLMKLELLIRKLADGSLKHEDVFNNMGHGALMYTDEVFEFGRDEFDVVVTGPRRSMFNHKSSIENRKSLRPYFAVPFGDMMIAGCFGLLAATGEILPGLGEAVRPVERRARASAHRVDARYLLDGGKSASALRAWMRAFFIHPPTALARLNIFVSALLNLMGLDFIRSAFLSRRSRRVNDKNF